MEFVVVTGPGPRAKLGQRFCACFAAKFALQRGEREKKDFTREHN